MGRNGGDANTIPTQSSETEKRISMIMSVGSDAKSGFMSRSEGDEWERECS